MKKLAVCLAFVFALSLNASVFAQRVDPTQNGNSKREIDITWKMINEEFKGDLKNPELFALLQTRVAVANSSVLADEVSGVILDNSGNYTFFKKQGSNSGDVEDRTGATMYIKAFGAQEKLDMENYTKFDTTYYGAVLGLDWDRKYTNCFDATYGLFISYAGGEIKGDEKFEDYDCKLSSNNGFAGLRGNWYIGKLFFGAVLDYGFMANKVQLKGDGDDYSKDFNVQSIGFSAKAGYNFEVAKRSFTIQPNVVFNSNYLIIEEYRFPDLENNPKFRGENIINLAAAPGLKLAKTLGKCWIVSAEGKYAFVSAEGDVKAEDNTTEAKMPKTYYKDYASCGLGIEKIWGYTVLHIKGHKNFCGRDGYMVNAGIEFKF